MLVAGGIKFIGGFIDEEGALTDALTAGSFGGIMAGKGTYGLIMSAELNLETWKVFLQKEQLIQKITQLR